MKIQKVVHVKTWILGVLLLVVFLAGSTLSKYTRTSGPDKVDSAPTGTTSTPITGTDLVNAMDFRIEGTKCALILNSSRQLLALETMKTICGNYLVALDPSASIDEDGTNPRHQEFIDGFSSGIEAGN